MKEGVEKRGYGEGISPHMRRVYVLWGLYGQEIGCNTHGTDKVDIM